MSTSIPQGEPTGSANLGDQQTPRTKNTQVDLLEENMASVEHIHKSHISGSVPKRKRVRTKRNASINIHQGKAPPPPRSLVWRPKFGERGFWITRCDSRSHLVAPLARQASMSSRVPLSRGKNSNFWGVKSNDMDLTQLHLNCPFRCGAGHQANAFVSIFWWLQGKT